MKNRILTVEDMEHFAATARHALKLFIDQYALIRPHFRTVTDEAVEAMIARVEADPDGTKKTPNIDAAVYFAALYTTGVRKLESYIATLPERGVDGLRDVFELIPACANAINALTLLSRGGLMPQLHLDEAQSVARKKVASDAARQKHARTNAAKAWVIEQWRNDSGGYPTKTDFARIHVDLVAQKFDGLKVTAKTITDNWLS